MKIQDRQETDDNDKMIWRLRIAISIHFISFHYNSLTFCRLLEKPSKVTNQITNQNRQNLKKSVIEHLPYDLLDLFLFEIFYVSILSLVLIQCVV